MSSCDTAAEKRKKFLKKKAKKEQKKNWSEVFSHFYYWLFHSCLAKWTPSDRPTEHEMGVCVCMHTRLSSSSDSIPKSLDRKTKKTKPARKKKYTKFKTFYPFRWWNWIFGKTTSCVGITAAAAVEKKKRNEPTQKKKVFDLMKKSNEFEVFSNTQFNCFVLFSLYFGLFHFAAFSLEAVEHISTQIILILTETGDPCRSRFALNCVSFTSIRW